MRIAWLMMMAAAPTAPIAMAAVCIVAFFRSLDSVTLAFAIAILVELSDFEYPIILSFVKFEKIIFLDTVLFFSLKV